MVKEIEKTGIPVVHITAMTAVSMTVGANRVLQAKGGIPYNMCNPMDSDKAQEEQRYEMAVKAVKALSSDVKEQTLFC